MNFGLKVLRTNTQSGSYAVDLQWTHVRQVIGYYIYRAENESDDPNDWKRLTSNPIHVNYYQDRGFGGIPVDNDRITWFYKVIPILQDGTQWDLKESKSETFSHPLHGIQRFVAPTIRSRTHIMLDPSKFSAAEVVHFLVRKWAGVYCSCIDIRSRKVDANCPNCQGTGYAGAFELIENVYCRVRSTPMRLKGDSGGITVQETTNATIATYPILTEADIIIRLHNNRYRVRNVKARSIQGYTTAQTFDLEKMQLYDMAYMIPAPPILEPTQNMGRGRTVSNVLL